MATYIVTGAAGFIGAHVAETLMRDGHVVLGLDDLNPSYDVRLKEYRLQKLMEMQGFSFKKVDITQRQDMLDFGQAAAPVDAVVNLAARAGLRASLEDPWIFLETNVRGTLNLLDLCREIGIPKFVLASTSSVYGANPPLPTPESADTSRPLQPYAASKIAAETLCHSYHHLYDLDVTIFRYFTVYGPAGRPDMSIFRFIQWIREGRPLRLYGDGEQSRGLTYVDDIARATVMGLRPLGFEIINLGGHESVKINAIVRMLEARLERKAQVRQMPGHPADIAANWADIEKAGRLLGWEPNVSLSDGLDATVDWYLAERDWAQDVDTSD
jgi:nucleoside-diphosphate-sugar epimerase